MKTKKLPNKPSALIRVALADLAKVERSKKYVVNMDTYHSPYRDPGKCSVCFAGAVMAQTLGASSEEWWTPEEFNDEDKLRALDEFRVGEVAYGLDRMGVGCPPSVPASMKVPAYSKRTRLAFRAAMRKLATMLEKAGL